MVDLNFLFGSENDDRFMFLMAEADLFSTLTTTQPIIVAMVNRVQATVMANMVMAISILEADNGKISVLRMVKEVMNMVIRELGNKTWCWIVRIEL